MLDVDGAWLAAECPRCTYSVDFTFLQVRLGDTVICPCCKSNIRLMDEAASAEGAKRDLDTAADALSRALQGLGN
jgi:hypothetical protein